MEMSIDSQPLPFTTAQGEVDVATIDEEEWGHITSIYISILVTLIPSLIQKPLERKRMQNQEAEWVHLSSSSTEARPKIYSCNFCRRKFYSSQALGGHQNAHRRERGLLRHYHSQQFMTRSLGPQQHSNRHESSSDGAMVEVARYSERSTSFGLGWQWQWQWQRQPSVEANVMWAGSFRFGYRRSEEKPEDDELDLNLKL